MRTGRSEAVSRSERSTFTSNGLASICVSLAQCPELLLHPLVADEAQQELVLFQVVVHLEGMAGPGWADAGGGWRSAIRAGEASAVSSTCTFRARVFVVVGVLAGHASPR